jgi:hypothetical protein
MLTMLILVTCFSPYNGGKDELLLEETKPLQVDELFIDSGIPGWIKFYTNDTKYRSSRGYTLWTLRGAEGTLGTRTLRLRKPAGSSIAGYGMVLGYKIRLVEDEAVPVMLTVMINNNGQYVIGKVIDGTFNYISQWTPASALEAGSGQENIITVQYQGDNKYLLKFNGTVIREFTDEEEPRCAGEGKNGYMVVIAPADLNGVNNSSVEVWFKEE